MSGRLPKSMCEFFGGPSERVEGAYPSPGSERGNSELSWVWAVVDGEYASRDVDSGVDRVASMHVVDGLDVDVGGVGDHLVGDAEGVEVFEVPTDAVDGHRCGLASPNA
ncbi:hypothetical protein IU451_28640 [Nocardia cyriacigeorgica]|uniref:hypothetical protein n=1 Tax=Nocardia cyriacigeorgica TaxID=135487 RepID=UPI001892E493|nr:hypothetical protein [Nocardia cyriacigeorgica]MBF6326470.1 hypothetical protein [Nocardia cyriacigeorgica]